MVLQHTSNILCGTITICTKSKAFSFIEDIVPCAKNYGNTIAFFGSWVCVIFLFFFLPNQISANPAAQPNLMHLLVMTISVST